MTANLSGDPRTHVVGRDLAESLQILAGTILISGTLGLLLVLANLDVVTLPRMVYLGLFGAGVAVMALINGWRAGGIVVSWVASGIGAFPLTIAFAPSGPVELSLGAVLFKAGWWTLVLALVAGSIFHGLGLVIRALANAEL